MNVQIEKQKNSDESRHVSPHFCPLSQEILDRISNKKLDVPYCTGSPLQILDLYYPNGVLSNRCPVIIFVHGGAFANGTQRENHLVPILTGLERGYVIASIQYRRSREALFPAQIYDVKAAIRFLRAHADEWNLDPERFAVWGPSSGGWLASMVGLTAGNPAFEDLSQGYAEESCEVSAVVDWCGPCGGFLEMDRAYLKSGLGRATHNDPDSPESRFLGRPIREIPELVKMACPCTYVHQGMPPFHIIHGSHDQVVPVEQSILFYQTICRVAGEHKASLHIVEGKLHHGDPWYHEPWVADECLDFLDSVLK